MKKIYILVLLIMYSITLISCKYVNYNILNLPQEVISECKFEIKTSDFKTFEMKFPNYKDFDATKDIDEKYFEKYYLLHFKIQMNKTEDINGIKIEDIKIETISHEKSISEFDLLVFTISIEKQYSNYEYFINGEYYYHALVSLPKDKYIPGINYIYGFRVYDRQTNTGGSFFYKDKVYVRCFNGIYYD